MGPRPVIRPERAGDAPAVRAVTAAAFGRSDEADLVERLRRVPGYLGLVAVSSASLRAGSEGAVVGHVAFTPVALEAAPSRLYGLAPMAVAPERQRRGVGTALVLEGLGACRRAGVDAVFVLGHPAYYPRFGFRVAPVGNEYGAPPEAFMALELTAGALEGVSGTVRYDRAFAG